MPSLLHSTLSDLESRAQGQELPMLAGCKVGLEKENLRVRPDGLIAQSDHPAGLGSALANPYITTDYSEALLELVTPALPSVTEALNFLDQTQLFVQQQLTDDEIVWNTSMPCVLDGGEHIRIGNYGSSNIGQMKSVYRRGLGLRYGRSMQTIAGIHFNYSWPQQLWRSLAQRIVEGKNTAYYSDDLVRYASAYLEPATGQKNLPTDTQSPAPASPRFVSEMYLAATRNLLRNTWLIPLLFGASPAICKTFLDGRKPLSEFESHGNSTLYQPYATSLRMGDIGYNYSKKAAASITVDYSDLESYTADLHRLITTTHEGYAEFGLFDDQGRYQQLNEHLLQIENEYYSPVRPKQLVNKMEAPVLAKRARGILYAELRCLDLNIFEPCGMSEQQLHFLEIFMLHALLSESPIIADKEMKDIGQNMSTVAHRGRDPQATVKIKGQVTLLQYAARALLDDLDPVAAFMDKNAASGIKGSKISIYVDALQAQREKVENIELTPSARVLDELLSRHDSFYDFAREHSRKLADHCQTLEADAAIQSRLQAAVKSSVEKQQTLETEDAPEFGAFLKSYFSQLSDLPAISNEAG